MVESLEAPGANITGTSDYLDTNSIMELIFAADPDADKIGLLYDQGQDSSATPIAHAKEYLESKGIEVRGAHRHHHRRGHAWPPSSIWWPTGPTPCSPPPTTP